MITVHDQRRGVRGRPDDSEDSLGEIGSIIWRLAKVGLKVVCHARKWDALKLPKTGAVNLSLANFTRILDDSMSLQHVLGDFWVLDEPKIPFEIRWWSG
jgi:hypothetical protein